MTSDRQWRRFTAEFALDALADDPGLATNAQRVAAKDRLVPAIRAVVATLPTAEAERRCERADISWAPVGKPADLPTDPHLLASHGLLQTLIPRLGGGPDVTIGLPGLPLEFGGERERAALTRQPPAVGEHNGAILAEAGFTPGEVDRLAAAGVIASA